MSGAAQLAASPRGAALLEAEGILLDQPSFLKALSPPRADALARLAGASPRDGAPERLVYMGQQLALDYGASVLAKLAALDRLRASGEVGVCVLWMDVDRAGSEKRMTRISWPRPAGRAGIPLAPPGSKRGEPRFIELDPDGLKRAFDRLRTFLGEAQVDSEGLERYAALRELVDRRRPATLAELSALLTETLLRERGIELRGVRLSALLRERSVIDRIEDCLAVLPRVIEVFNGSVADLWEAGVDPLLHPLADDYLPLRIACEIDGSRLPLRRSDLADGPRAVAACRCGASYSFPLGRGRPSLDALVATERWSPDVLLPVFINDLASGVVAGKSSAVYGIVLNRVMREGLGRDPIPMLLPADLIEPASEPRLSADSLMVSHLRGEGP